MQGRLFATLLVALALAPAGARGETIIYHSPADDGVDPGAPVPLSPAQSFFLYADAGPISTGLGTPCFDGNGDEICAYRFCIETTGAVGIVSFVPDPAQDLVVSSDATRICATGGNALDGELGPLRIGELQVAVTGAGTVALTEGDAVAADLTLGAVTPRLLPEPGSVWQLAAGIAFLGLARARRQAVP